MCKSIYTIYHELVKGCEWWTLLWMCLSANTETYPQYLKKDHYIYMDCASSVWKAHMKC